MIAHLLCKKNKDKKLKFSMNGNRTIVGTLRGYDAFLNVVLEEAENADSKDYLGTIVIRGNSIIQFEGIERVAAT
jgi:small nuclear ribonucleoprotein G